MKWQGGKDIQLDFEWKYNMKSGGFVRFNCSKCGKLVFGVGNIPDKDMAERTIDLVDAAAVLVCGECNQR